MVASGSPINDMLWVSVRKKINIKMNDEFFFSLLKNSINDSDLYDSINNNKRLQLLLLLLLLFCWTICTR